MIPIMRIENIKWYTTKEFTGVVGGLKLSFSNNRSLQPVSSISARSIVSAENRIQAELITSETTSRKNSRAADQFMNRLYLGVLNNLFSYDNTLSPLPAKWGRFDSPGISAIRDSSYWQRYITLNDLFQLSHCTESLSSGSLL